MLTGGAPSGTPSQVHPVAQGAPAAPSASSAPSAPSNAGAAGGIAGPTPQQQDQFKASAAQYQQEKENDAGFTASTVPLQKVIQLLPKTLTGPGAEPVSNLAKVAQTFGINLPGSATQAQYYDELQKYATNLARQSGAAPNSDAQLLAAFSGNPNVEMNNAAASDVAKVMLSLSRMRHAGITIAQQQGMDSHPQDYSTFASQWGGQQDPRAYGVDLMTPAAAASLKAELQKNPAAAQRFITSYNAAKAAGIYGQAQQ